MKKLICLSVIMTLVSCGEVKDLGQGLIDFPSEVAKDLLRIDESDNVDILQENSLNTLESRVSALERANKANSNLIAINSSNIGNNIDEIATIDGILIDLQVQIDGIESTLLNLDASQTTQNSQIASILNDLTSIENSVTLLEQAAEKAIKEIIDPCGDKVGKFDEILLVLNSGEIVAYFEQGGKRFLTVLSDGNYRTTDAQRCNFSVVGGAYVE